MQKSLSDFIIERAKRKPLQKIVVACAADKTVLLSIKSALEMGLITPILIGEKEKIEKIAKEIKLQLENIELIDQSDLIKASHTAVYYVKNNMADLLMKGNVSTSIILKAALDKQNGIGNNNLLNHIAICQIPSYHKYLTISDAALNISPKLNHKVKIIQNCVKVLHKLGYLNPKIGILTPVEVLNPKIESTVHAVELIKMNAENIIKGCQIDGPFSLDIAISKEAAKHKNNTSSIAGDVDMLLAPDLNSGNILYKAINFIAGGSCAALTIGGKSPIILSSRADNEENKLLSIALACAINE
jgi:phosphate butyryltransferase